jgi:hypothetical protein
VSEITLVRALNNHLRLPGEEMVSFASQLKRLTATDKEWLSNRFRLEYGYTIVASPTFAIGSGPLVAEIGG